MIGHDDVIIHEQFISYFERFYPIIINDFSKIWKYHFIIIDVSQITFPVLRNNGDKINTIAWIIPLWHPVRWYSIFILKFIHYSATWATLRFLRRRASLICSPTTCICCSNLRGSFVPIVFFAILFNISFRGCNKTSFTNDICFFLLTPWNPELCSGKCSWHFI